MMELTIKGNVIVNGIKVPNISGGFGEGKKAMLAMHIAHFHSKEPKHINENINKNITKFKNGVDIIDVKNTDFQVVLTDLKILAPKTVGNAKNIYLLSERGYAKLLKILDDDLAWEMYDILLDEYFEMKEQVRVTPSYMIDDPIERAERWIEEQKRMQELEIEKQQLLVENAQLEDEIDYREETMMKLVDEVSLAEKRQHLNRIIRHGYDGKQISARWKELYMQFELKYHVDLNRRLERYQKENSVKISKIEYIDAELNRLPELYELACKLYENDIEKLAKELYDLAN